MNKEQKIKVYKIHFDLILFILDEKIEEEIILEDENYRKMFGKGIMIIFFINFFRFYEREV